MDLKRVTTGLSVFFVLAVGMASVADAQIEEPEQRLFISIDSGFQLGSQQVQHEALLPGVYGENQITATDYSISRTGPVVRANVGARLWGNLGLGFGYTLSAGTADGPVTVSVPHPVLSDRMRLASAEVSNLKHQEDSFHFQALFILPVDDRVHLQFFGGPSMMTVKQTAVVGASAAEVGSPFTEITLEGLEYRLLTKRGFGFNVGMDFSYMFRDNYGAGVFVQYVGGAVNFQEDNGPDGLRVGGIQLGGGLRIRF